jgi:hypothetical protein
VLKLKRRKLLRYHRGKGKKYKMKGKILLSEKTGNITHCIPDLKYRKHNEECCRFYATK